MTRRATAFTLFEVALSLGLLAFGVLGTLLLFPMGIRAQQVARFQLYAAAKAEEMVDSFCATHNANPSTDVEAFATWDVPTGYSPQAWDLEKRIPTQRFGVLPLPTVIARRLDCDNGEIQRILDEGGRLYYAQPMATADLEDQALQNAKYFQPGNEAQSLVFAVVGYAQDNAVPVFPCKAWPYMVPYPSPPLHGLHYDQFLTAGTPKFNFSGPAICWEAATVTPGTSLPGADDDIKKVWAAYYAYSGYSGTPGTVEQATAYLQAALWYCQKKGLPADFYAPSTVPKGAAVPDFAAGTLDGQGNDFAHGAWKQVTAMRFLAHAALCMTRWKTLAELGGTPSSGGVPVMASTDGSPAITLTHDLIVYYHERCLRLGMRYAASFPYDWAAPRPLQNPTMMDYPLIGWDMFQPPATGTLYGSGGTTTCQWKPVPAKPIANIGLSYQFPGYPLPDASAAPTAYAAFWGDAARFTLTKPFQPAERCRQIVFWSADWRSYVDAETAPSATVDAGRYPLIAPALSTSSGNPLTFDQRMDATVFQGEQLYTYRNPESAIAFNQSVATWATGRDVTGIITYDRTGTQPDKGTGLAAREMFSGVWGADRNFNGVLDRGSVPPSVRLRAQSVARFAYYDPRLPVIAR